MKLDCYSENSGYYHLSHVASSLLFAVVHAVISMVGVVSVGFGFDNHGLAADYTVDLGFADFEWRYFETIETEMVAGAAGFEEIVVVVVVDSVIAVVGMVIVVAVVGKGVVVVVVVGKLIVVVVAVVGKGTVVVAVVGKGIAVVVVGKVIVVAVAAVGKVTVVVAVVGKMIVVVDIDHMAAVALVEQQQNFPLDDMAVVV